MLGSKVLQFMKFRKQTKNLEYGSPAPLLLNFALFLLGVAITSMLTLISINIPSTRVFCTFMILTIVGYISGGILLVISIIQILKTKSVGKTIRDRAARGEPQQVIEGKEEVVR